MRKLVLGSLFLLASFSSQAQFWTQTNSDFPTESTGISRFDIVDENIAWGIGYNGINPSTNLQQFSKTVNGGNTWDFGTFNVGNTNLGIGDISAIDAQKAFISVYPRSASQQGGVWQTIDGGATWTKITSSAFTAAASFPNVIHFFDASNGVVVGDPVGPDWEIYTTTDAGVTFTAVPSANIPAPGSGETGYIAQKATFGDSIWFTTSTGRLYHSSNRGLNWSVYNTPISDFGGANTSGDISFSNATKGILQTNSGVLYRTLNSGQTWNQITISGTGTPYGDNIAYVPNSTAIVSVGSNPDFSGSSFSKDDGVTWFNIDNVQHVDVAMFSAVVGYSGGFTSSSDTTGVFKVSSSELSNENFAFAKAISIYPNPAKDILYISNIDSLESVKLINLNGQIIKEFPVAKNLSLEGVAAGMYLVKITTKNGVETLPLIKQGI